MLGDLVRGVTPKPGQTSTRSGLSSHRRMSIPKLGTASMILRRARVALWLTAVTAALVVSSGCAASEGTAHQRSSPSQCGSGIPKPVSVGTVIRVFAKNGVALRPVGSCLDPEAVATIANDPLHVTQREQRKALAEHGSIICGLYASSRGSKLTKLTYGGGAKAATYSVLNVSCTIYPTSPKRYLKQDKALEQIVRSLSAEKNA